MARYLAIALSLGLSACASAGTAFEWKNAKAVSIGMTQAEVVALMGGPPNSVTSRGDQVHWVFVNSTSSFVGSFATKHVSFTFKAGRVVSVPDLTQFQ